MEQQALKAFTDLCDKIGQMIEDQKTKMAELEDKIKVLESMNAVVYTQQQVADITGWSVAAVNNWVKQGFIVGIPVRGKKNVGIPASEVKVILAKKGQGKKKRA